ncbi:type III polyketide synthase [Dongia rigui]|uniref:Type III polyketide synthase n=1 Tax=Dongia rigui TaxID=940149 RepID=A0ABU5DTQ7_9PROT|nr:type III polyketide synthase [Dongia rigui]MDY0870704.1 type III polyketide synthase [Dongia rigui]
MTHSHKAHINRIGVAVPAHDVHDGFLAHARALLDNERTARLFDRAARRSGIAHRFSHMPVAEAGAPAVDATGFYRYGDFPTTAQRMEQYVPQALTLAEQAIAKLELGKDIAAVTHLIVASCTGFSAPGLDLQLVWRLGLSPQVERQLIGFMGCSAAIPALRAAHHIVRAQPDARVLVVNVEICTLHFQATADLETMLSFLLFGDGCAAALVTAEAQGIALEDFRSVIIPQTDDLITWTIGDQGFEMFLSGQVPGRITQALRQEAGRSDDGGILRGEGTQSIDLWAVHAGGRSILDAVEVGLALPSAALEHSRAILNDFGNMSSATIMFVLQRMLQTARQKERGMAMAFGPGMVAETARFSMAA